MLEHFKEEINQLTAGQRWRFRRFLYKLEESDIPESLIEYYILSYIAEEILNRKPEEIAVEKDIDIR